MGIRTRCDVEKPQLENHRNLMREHWLGKRRWFVFLLLFLCSGCAFFQPKERFGAAPVSYEALPGWRQDDHVAALKTFLASCAVLAAKARPAAEGSGISVSERLWKSLCEDGKKSLLGQEQARLFFERRFMPYRVNNNGREQGLFTGYYEPVLYGAFRQYGDFQYPLYMAPPELKNSRSYYTHAEINDGALAGRKLEMVWVDDPVMLFFLQVQGSGRVKLTSGKELYVGYAGKNNQPYVSLGKVMGEQGLLPKDQINFFTIRQWLYQHRAEAFRLMEKNPSYVFFEKRSKPGAIGAIGAVLTPMRSLAVDSRYIPYGLPLYIETELPAYPQQQPAPLRRLMTAQDTGGAIRSPVRADIFFGTGDEAEYLAGYMAKKGVYTLLVPKEITYQVPR